MPFSGRDKEIYNKGYYAGYRRATIDHLGGKCAICGTTERPTIHHIKPLNRRQRGIKDLKDLSKLELRCEDHHPDLVKRRK